MANQRVVQVANIQTGQVQHAFVIKHTIRKMVVAWPAAANGQMALLAQQGGGFSNQQYIVYGGNITC